jgi:putative transposase
MPVKALIIPLEQGSYYHVYNRGNNKDILFHSKEDYEFFLMKYHFYLDAYLKTYAYCFLPNHFHFLVSVIQESGENGSTVSNQFRKLFISHSRRINYQKRRSGCLLTRNFRRTEITNEFYLRNLVLYIHYNPIKHGISTGILQYPYSSFSLFLSSQNSQIERQEVIEWFDGLSQFLVHHHLIEIEGEEDYPINDDEQ